MAKRAFWQPTDLVEYELRMAAETAAGVIALNAGECGGPRVSLVAPLLPRPAAAADRLPGPTPDGTAPANDAAVPLPLAPPPAGELDPPPFYAGFELAPSARGGTGWSVARQRNFLEQLAETGSVHLAADAAGISARSAYRLRTRSPAFAAAWNSALRLAVGRLAAVALDRAIHGRIEQQFENGFVVSEKRVPSDRLLTWLLPRLDPHTFGPPSETRAAADPAAAAHGRFPAELAALSDVSAEALHDRDLR